MNTTDAGRVGEAKVLAALSQMGWYPFVDISGKCPVDILAWKDGRCIAVQVKATSYAPNGRYVVQVGSIRPNRTGNTIHKFDPSSCDYLAVYVAPNDEVHFIKATDIKTGRQITVDTAIKTLVL